MEERQYFGFRGKHRKGEDIKKAAIRKLEEKVGLVAFEVKIDGAECVIFLFPYDMNWNQTVHVFQVRSWKGEPVGSAEMQPL